MRVPAITSREQVPPPYRYLYDEIAESRGGALTGPFWALMNSPIAAARTASLGAYVRYESAVPERLVSVAAMTVARTLDNHYEWTVNENAALRAGVPRASLDAIRDRTAPAGLEGDDLLAFRFCHELLQKNRVSEEAWSALEQRFGLKIVTDLCAAIGYYACIALVMNAFEVMPGPERPTTLPV